METTITIDNYKTEIEKYINLFNLNVIDVNEFIRNIEKGLPQTISSADLAAYCSETAASLCTVHEQYDKLAAIILVSYNASICKGSFVEKILHIQNSLNTLNPEIVELVKNNSEIIQSIIDYSRDYNINYFGLVTLLKSYVVTVDDIKVERPQDVYMRVALQFHRNDFEKVKETYDLLSLQYYTHATPTMYSSCFSLSQLASCFLVASKEDTIAGIFKTLEDIVQISKRNGGIGLHLHNLRCNGSRLVTSGGCSKGIVPIVKIINDALKYINKGAARRQSPIAIYLEPWHADIFEFLELRKNAGIEEFRARDIFTALWTNDLFMERVRDNAEWSLFDPNVAFGLSDCYGEEFKKLYEKYEKTLTRKVVPAQKLWQAILSSQIETGTPYMCYKDSANRNSNQQNLGVIKSSNLCAEIIQYSSPDQTAMCNLASICLKKFVTEEKTFDFEKLKYVVSVAVKNLNKSIDTGFYLQEIAKKSNLSHRPMALGVQGLADVFIQMGYPFESEEAKNMNKLIFEAMYFAALETSCLLSKEFGPYSSFQGSPLSKGIFHFETFCPNKKVTSGMFDWETLRENIKKYGVRNSLFIGCMPTSSTSQICNNIECFGPISSNIFTRRTFAGEFQVVNYYLINDLIKRGLWNNSMRNLIIEYEGSIQRIPNIPQDLKDLYKTVWEIKMKTVLEMSADRQAFIDQSQSLNVFLPQPTYSQLSSMHFYGWSKGLKTGMYYLRTNPVASAIKFTVNQELVESTLSSLREAEAAENNSGEPENSIL